MFNKTIIEIYNLNKEDDWSSEIVKFYEDQLKKIDYKNEKMNIIKEAILEEAKINYEIIEHHPLFLFDLIKSKLNYYFLKICFNLLPFYYSTKYEDQIKKSILENIKNFKQIKLTVKKLNAEQLINESIEFQKSEYFLNFIKLVKKLKEEDNKNFNYDQLICYNLRSFNQFNRCKQELLFLICLKNYFHIKNCKIFANNLSPFEIRQLRRLNFYVKCVDLETYENWNQLDIGIFKYNLTTDDKVLVLMSPFKDEENELILEQNWNPKILNNIHLISTSFTKIIKYNFNFKKDKLFKPNSYVFNSSRKLKIVKQFKIKCLDKKVLNYFTLHKFNTKNLDEDTLQSYYSDYFKLHFDILTKFNYKEIESTNYDNFLEDSNKFKESKFFQNFIKNFELFKEKLNDDFKFDKIVLYLMANCFFVYKLCYDQCLWLICLKNYLGIECEIYDPNLTDDQKEILKQLDFKLIDDEIKQPIEKKTLFYIPDLYFLDVELCDNIFKYNWNLKSLSNLYIMDNCSSFGQPPYGWFSLVYAREEYDFFNNFNLNFPYRSTSFYNLKCIRQYSFKPQQDDELYGLSILNYLSLFKFDVSKLKDEDLINNKYLENRIKLNEQLIKKREEMDEMDE